MNKKLLIVFVAVLLLGIGIFTFRIISNSSIPVSDEECFTFNADEGKITGIKEVCGTKINIPSKINGTKVTTIGSFALANKEIEVLILPDTLKEIGIGAFENNLIKELVIPKSVDTIKTLAFHKNKISKLTIPDSVKNIGNEAFNDNEMKTKDAFIYLRSESGVVEDTIVSYAGAERDNVIVPSGTDMIYVGSFKDCNIKKIALNKELTRIESKALENNDLKEIEIPSNVIIVGLDAFSGNDNLKKITVKGKTSLDDFSLFDITDLDTKIIEFKK